jgi:UDP-glucose 4-epimerase
MTRFMMSLEDAVELVLFAFTHGNSGDTFIQKAPAATIRQLAEVLCELFDYPHNIREIGTRHGEKLYESLLTREEMATAEDMDGYYRVGLDTRDLNYGKYTSSGRETVSEAMDYTSHNTNRLSKEGLKELLLKLDYVQKALAGQNPEAY